MPLKTLLHHCNEIVQNFSSFCCVDWRKGSPGIKLLKSLQVLALSQTSWCVYGQGHKFLGFPFPIREGNTITAFPFSYFVPAHLVTEKTSGQTLVSRCLVKRGFRLPSFLCITKESLSTSDNEVNCKFAKANSLKTQDNCLQKHVPRHLPGSTDIDGAPD